MAKGFRDATNLVLPVGWDAAALKNFQLQDGTSLAIIAGDLGAAIAAANAELANDPLWAGLVSFADQPEVEYRVGVSNGFEVHTEYGRPDAQRADTTGHMLPIIGYDRRLGWTWDFLRKARASQIEADIADAIKDMRDIWRKAILGRLLKRLDDSGASKGLGASGYSTGFATAAASTNVDFIPPAFGGTAFDANHEHYVPLAGGAFTAAVFADIYDELREHGHEPPFDVLIGPADRATVEGLTGFVKAVDPLVQAASSTAIANVNPMDYIGTISHCRVREVRGMPQYYGVGYKSYGPNSQRNPLRIRVGKGESAPRAVLMYDDSGRNPDSPLQSLKLFFEFGVGVADRTAGTPRYVNNAAWSDGTPT